MAGGGEADARTVVLRGRDDGDTPVRDASAIASRPWTPRLSLPLTTLVMSAAGAVSLAAAAPRGLPPVAVVTAGLALGALFGAALAALLFSRIRARLEKELDEARRLRNWRLEELLGQGGMGEVWRASHVVLPRPGAIKFIRPEALGAGDAQSAQTAIHRFRREARAVAGLSSPHTIEIYDFGVADDGSLSYVMEFLDGMDLETLVRTHGPLTPARAVHLLRQVCISLAEAHQAGLVHRDVKPANIYACRKGIQHDFVKVLDFGMVADLTGRVDGSPTTWIGGTPAYVAPEIVTGRAYDGRSDLYSLGGVTYFLLTGETVFGGKTTAERIAHQVHTRPTAPSTRAPHPVPRELDLVVLACLAKNPDERPRSAAELSRRLALCDVGAPWSPGQAMEWWTAKANGTLPPSGVVAPSTATRAVVERVTPRPASAIHAR